MERTKANFKAIREMLGLSQQDIADLTNVSKQTVKRWERPEWPNPPEDVWSALLNLLETQSKTVAIALDAAAGHKGVQLTYYRTQEQYDARGMDDGPVGMANANARLTAHILLNKGIDVTFSYPDDTDNLYHTAG